MPGLRSFEGAVALVTGGASGIGAALGRELARRGARRCSPTATPPKRKRRPRESRRRAAAPRRACSTCATRRRSTRPVADVFARHGRLDYLFNNAGIAVGGEAVDLRLEDWREAVEVNLMGVIHGVQAAWPRLAAQGFGHVVNTASMAAFLPTALAAPYGTTKSAVLGLSLALRLEGEPRGLRVSALCPGVIRTAILDGGRHGRLRNFIPAATLAAMNERLRPMDADLFARRALDDVARDKDVIVHPRGWRLVRLLQSTCPWLVRALSRREYAKVRPLLGK
jgi:NAD(P)-dependent dehydrogenase (short-subunit alcohol dehydrogenase family)